MPGHHLHPHVRFAPVTSSMTSPSPSYSTSSLPPQYQSYGLSSPQGPPPINYTGSPYANVPLPPTDQIHAQLSSNSSLGYDVSRSPATINVPSKVMNQYASTPPSTSMTITHSSASLPAIHVVSRTGSYITVGDVLNAIYTNLRLGGPEAAQNFSQLHPSQKQQVELAYKARYKSYSDSREYEMEKMKGVKAVDFLVGNTRFRGLQQDNYGNWILHLSSGHY